MARFDGMTVLITGASSGIGEALAREFSRQGASVALLARRRERLDALKNELEAAGGKAAVFPCDVTDAEAVRKAAEETAATFGGIDIAVANAGFGVAGQITSLTVDDYRRQFELNYFGTLNTIYAVLPWLEKRRGRLVLIGSVAGKVFTPSTSAYNSSKAAIIGLAESIWHELDEIGVSLTCVNPGFVASEIRSVDNYGRYTGNPDPVPSWL
ncbi:MAG TPA: SDR family NAD(P)-dependent oxidoreductase, partial [Candidatus Hydrogenedentes bacterium]|nr:SDR family NAD(P)-dependent oxidoreductase [Candidatus Hydrogenedentota bacterium]